VAVSFISPWWSDQHGRIRSILDWSLRVSDSPYSPPKTEVSDRVPVRALAERPKQVAHAVALLWLSLLLGIPATVYEHRQTPPGASGAAVILGLVVLLYVVGAGLNIFAARGHNWARITLLVFSGLAVAMYISMIQEYLERPVLYLALDLVTLVLDWVALYLLFTKPGALWFRRIE
jgi:hypothetical protein